MQILPFILTQLPQFVMNLTNPSATATPLPQATDANIASGQTFTLPALPYAYDALEPYLSAQIMMLHHSKHHQAYVNDLNDTLARQMQAVVNSDLKAQVALPSPIKYNGGGHISHSLFWANLAPPSSPAAQTDSAPKLMSALKRKYGSFEAFKQEFKSILLELQGSGWGWLVNRKNGELDIVTTKDQDLVGWGAEVVFGVDMWEHAYYLQYFNDKASYLDGIWNIINWDESERRFLGLGGQLKL